MSRANDLTEYAVAGYRAMPHTGNPHLQSSAAWYAWRIGAWFSISGRPVPRDVRMGRGYKVHASDMLFNGDTLERLS